MILLWVFRLISFELVDYFHVCIIRFKVIFSFGYDTITNIITVIQYVIVYKRKHSIIYLQIMIL